MTPTSEQPSFNLNRLSLIMFFLCAECEKTEGGNLIDGEGATPTSPTLYIPYPVAVDG